ncbi:MAG: sulfurtransferase [Aerococcaceae bacterium]|nr:sulfurtransferase [Aerococcaceae bacterium]
MLKNFIEPSVLLNQTDAIILDVRRGSSIQSGKDLYDREHVQGAYYLDLESDLSGEVTELTGAHPLPNKTEFEQILRNMGATNNSEFFVYDDGDQFVAARAWFVLKYFGIQSVKLIGGGFPALKKSAVKMSSKTTPIKNGTITLLPQAQMVTDFDTVKDFSENGKENTVLLDVRAKERYLGQVETIYHKAGHIPRAQSYFYRDIFAQQYELKDKEALQVHFEAIMDKDIILSCGSGVTAAMTMIALDELGKSSKVYVGSYSEWIKRGEKVETSDEMSDN